MRFTPVLLFLVLGLCLGRTAPPPLQPTEPHVSSSEDTSEAVSRMLLQVFGMREQHGHRRRERHHLPPLYMLQLYNATAGASGITRTANPYNANLVRSFPDKVRRHYKKGRKKSKDVKPTKSGDQKPKEGHLRFFFNVTPNESDKEEVLQAEFHLYKLKPRHKLLDKMGDAAAHLLEVRVYQVMPGAPPIKEEGNRLLDVRRMTYNSMGWEVFYVKAAVVDWIKEPATNLGLLMTVRTASGKRLEDGVLRFAKRNQGHVNKQPILVVFSDDGRPKHELPYTGNKAASQPASPNNRTARATSTDTEPLSCTRQEMYVDFEQIGWTSWIISPMGYNAYYCRGVCPFPLGQNQWPTNHATLQSIVNELNPGYGKPCCVPNKLYPISLLYFDESDNVVLKQYDDMVAASCGCH
ncbi:bone morphogenetic protein 2-like [Ornithodoros turicata]|uniref:bone morphogenetic protein 2-like n=1 Tax=Ornithodoros turicata TaxID=34597 RepID=UPI003138E18C